MLDLDNAVYLPRQVSEQKLILAFNTLFLTETDGCEWIFPCGKEKNLIKERKRKKKVIKRYVPTQVGREGVGHDRGRNRITYLCVTAGLGGFDLSCCRCVYVYMDGYGVVWCGVVWCGMVWYGMQEKFDDFLTAYTVICLCTLKKKKRKKMHAEAVCLISRSVTWIYNVPLFCICYNTYIYRPLLRARLAPSSGFTVQIDLVCMYARSIHYCLSTLRVFIQVLPVHTHIYLYERLVARQTSIYMYTIKS